MTKSSGESMMLSRGQRGITSTMKTILEPRQHISSKMPYANKRYDLKEFNPTPNEVAFLGGLGNFTGNTRSKAHVQRPSMNQILFKMRTANRILFTFSEDPILAHALTRKQLEGMKSPKQIRKRDMKRDLAQKISKIQIADNIIKVSTPTEVDHQRTSPTSDADDVLTKPVELLLPRIDAGVKKSTTSSRTLSLGAMKKISFAFKATDVLKGPAAAQPPQQPEKSFREWALEEREKRLQALQQVSLQQIKQEREANEIFPKSKNSKLPKIFLSGQRRAKKDVIAGAEHLAGAMFGPFIENKGPDKIMANQTKFHVPLSMFSRATVETRKKALSRKKLIKARLDYMKIPQIASDSEGEGGEDDVLEDIKELSFVRTPFNLIPTVHHGKRSRTERLKTATNLRGNRLKRINLLLFDRKVSVSTVDESVKQPQDEDELTSGASEEVQQLQLPTVAVKKKFDSEYRQQYHEYLHEKYLEQLEQYNENLNQKLNSLNEIESDRVTSTHSIERKSFRDFCVAEMAPLPMQPPPPPVQPDIAAAPMKDPAFKKVKRKIQKNMRFSRNDIRTGEFYFDPFLLEKVHNPEKGMRLMKNYTSLMRSQSNLRQRLQVNAAKFDEERCGSFYHRLVTEWDQFYISEIRHRPKAQKFCVKSDIIRIREMVRKKFFLYFMQEDLMKLFAEQEIENSMIDKTTKFIKACEPQFKQLQDESFQAAKEKLEMVTTVTADTAVLKAKYEHLSDQLDLLMERLMSDERRWENIMMMQNFYYLIMPPLWRLEHDWIHRSKAGQLDFLRKSVIYCKKIHIRSKSVTEISLHSIKNFFETVIEPTKLAQMRRVTPDVELLRTSLEDIKSNVLGVLNKHNEIMMKSSEIQFQQKQLEKTIPVVISAYEKNMSRIERKVEFVRGRVEYLMGEVERTSNVPLTKCVKNVFMRKIDAICRHLTKTLFVETFMMDESIKKHTLVENFCMISSKTMKLLSELDNLPTGILHAAERESRLHRKEKLRQGRVAMNEQNMFKMLEKQLKNHFTKTFKPKPRRKSKRRRRSLKIVSSIISMAGARKAKEN